MSSVNLTGSPPSKMASPFVNSEDKENEVNAGRSIYQDCSEAHTPLQHTLKRAFNGVAIQGPLANSKMVNQLPITVSSKVR